MLTRSPTALVPRVVTAERVGNEHDGKPVVPHVDQGQADAVDGDRALRDHEFGPARVDFEFQELPFPLPVSFAQDGGGVDMALNEVSSQPVAHLECALEVDAIAGLPVAQVGSLQRFRPGLNVKLVCRTSRRP